jgi:exopolyphosphatase / guanosine-5'-triphosphate,3'-diphosphate pyrophosphatase
MGPRARPAPLTRLAAIDIGSNSIHMVAVEVEAAGHLRVIGRAKEMVRLGAGISREGELSPPAAAQAVAALRRCRRLAEARGAQEVVAVATSAVRDAMNGPEFLERVTEQTGLRPRAISGEEEARLIYRAARHSMPLPGRRALVVDLGGGSVELALGAGDEPDWAASEKLGVLRLAEQFGQEDPLPAADRRRLADHVASVLAPHTDRARREGFGSLVATSGTLLALGALAAARGNGRAGHALHHAVVKTGSLRKVTRQLVRSSLEQRLRLRGLEPRRADIIVMGAVVLEVLLHQLGAETMLLCEWALREGILLDHLQRRWPPAAAARQPPDVRRRSVTALAERCGCDARHGRQVARLALELFEATRPLHHLGAGERSLLEYAALVHDAGRHVSSRGHHKHSEYLIRHGDLRGFAPAEIEVLAGVARYHRGRPPRRRHPAFARLSGEQQWTVSVLAGILRVADALDAGHAQVVRLVSLAERGGVLLVQVELEGDGELELRAAESRCGLLERTLERTVRFAGATAAAWTGRAVRRV